LRNSKGKARIPKNAFWVVHEMIKDYKPSVSLNAVADILKIKPTEDDNNQSDEEDKEG
jgi:hypothetical protein